MTIRLIAIDMDGTLLNDNHEVTPETLKTLHQARDKGCTIILCTGRSPQNGLPVMEQLDLKGLMITHNGAVTVESKTKEVISRFPIQMDNLLPLIRICRERHLHFDVCTDFELYYEQMTDVEMEMYIKFGLAPVSIDNVEQISGPIVKMTVFGEKTVLDRAFHEFSSFHAHFNIIRSGDTFIDIQHRDASKGNALREVSRKMGVDPTEIVAFGNYYNDVDMIEYAGIGVAMENAPDGVKEQADAVTLSNNEEGVSHFLRQLL